MKTVSIKKHKYLFTFILLLTCINVWNVFTVSSMILEEDVEVGGKTGWNGEEKALITPITITKHSNYLTIQDSNPVNTVTVKITSNETGATVFENVYPQGQTSFIVIPINGWSAGSYTIELFGRENNGYLWGTFQVLP